MNTRNNNNNNVLSVAEAVDLLRPFLYLPAIQNHVDYVLISSIEANLNQILNKHIKNIVATEPVKVNLNNELCDNLHKWMNDKSICDIKIDDKYFSDVMYEMVLTLADIDPINEIDFATQDEIHPANKIVTSDRYQHDIVSLKSWLPQKITNPWTKQVFNNRDLQRIKNIFSARYPDIVIQFAKAETYLGGDPSLAMSMELARLLEDDDFSLAAEDASPTFEQPSPEFTSFFSGAHDFEQHQSTTTSSSSTSTPPDSLPSFANFSSPSQNQLAMPTSLSRYFSTVTAVQLANGNFVIANPENEEEIQLINPATQQVVLSIQVPGKVGVILLLDDGKIAVGYDKHTQFYSICFNIYDPVDGMLINTMVTANRNVLAQLTCVGENIVIAAEWYSNAWMTFVDGEAGYVMRAIATSLQIESLTRSGSNYIMTAMNTDTNDKACTVYDSNFIPQAHFRIEVPGSCLLLKNNNILIAHARNIYIYNPRNSSTDKLVKAFELEGGGASIASIMELDNGNLLLSAGHDIFELTENGTCVRQAHIDQMIQTSVMLKEAYKSLWRSRIQQYNSIPSFRDFLFYGHNAMGSSSSPSQSNANHSNFFRR